MRTSPHRWTVLACAFALLIGVWLVMAAQAAPAQAQLPPRPTLTPTVTPTATPVPSTAMPFEPAVRIRLLVDPVYEGHWSLVQWQGEDGQWHDVSGWLGQIEDGRTQWRVLPKDFDSGPFRWVVLDQPDGVTLVVSDPFTLPNRADPLRVVDLTE